MNVRSLLAVALLAPAVAFAAPASGSKSSSKSSSSAAAKVTPPAKSADAPASQYGGLEVGGFIGYETDDVSGLALRLDGEIPFRALTEPGASTQVKMSWVGTLGYSHLTKSFPFGDFTANIIKVIPAARFTIPLNPQFSVFGDVGLGIAYVSATVETPGFPGIPPFIPATPGGEVSDSSFNIMMRIGAGAWFHVNPQLKVGAMLEFDPIFGDFGYASAGSQNTFNILVGTMYRL